MKLNFKNLLIVFLVALLGGVIGTFGVIEINKATGNKIIEQGSSAVLTTVEYPAIEKSNYTVAIDKAYNSVVEITSTVNTTSFFGTSSSQKLGSGVILTSDGYIVTNNHVVESAVDVSVKLYDGTIYEAEVLGTDEKTDLAVLKIEANDLYYSALVDSDELVLGEECIVIGNPLGEGISCSNGIISALNKEITIDNYTMYLIQTNAAVNEGNSGGGLFNMNGDLIGVVNAKSSSSYYSSATIEGMGYAIPSNTVSKIVADLSEYGYVKQRATLGVSVYTNTYYDQNDITGCIVGSVQEDGAAEKAGIKQYDIIAYIDDNQITDYASLAKVLDNYNVGDEATIVLYRGLGDQVNNQKAKVNLKRIEVKLKFKEAVIDVEESEN